MAQIILDSNNNLIQGDFDNATVNNRTKFKTTTTNATTNVYAVPNGSATSAGFTVTNAADPTNASKLTIATNGSTDTQIISGVNGSGTYLPLSFYTNNALAMQITTGGIISAAGGGIQFPATQIPSADANTLDDYEEGTFTAVVRGSSTAGTYTITSQTSVYTKIGRLVSISIYISGFSAASGGTGYMMITGLPFSNLNAAKGSFSGSSFDFSTGTLFATPAFVSISGVTTLYLEEVKDNAGVGDFPISGVSTSSSNIGITITYATS